MQGGSRISGVSALPWEGWCHCSISMAKVRINLLLFPSVNHVHAVYALFLYMYAAVKN